MSVAPSIFDPTLLALRAVVEKRAAEQAPRAYLGMSSIGHPCERKLWYSWRWVYEENFDTDTLWRFEDGFRCEDVMADRLRLVTGINLRTVDPRTGEQFRFTDLGGHFSGHADGMIQGLKQAPVTVHVWEAKAVNEKKFAELVKLKSDLGEKAALAKWDPIYYAQGVLYMAYSETERHYLTASTPGARAMVSVRTDTNLEEAARLRAKAERIINSPEPPPKINESPAWYQCKMCDAYQICHGNAKPVVSCRTCVHATPEKDGNARWSCAKWGADIPLDAQAKGCGEHRFIPALVKLGKPVDADPVENWIEYEAANGKRFRNGAHGASSYGSEELRHLTVASLGDPITESMRADFGAVLVESE